MPEWTAFAIVVAGVFVLWILARLIGRWAASQHGSSNAAKPGYSLGEIVVGLSVGIGLALIGAATSVPLYWVAAAVACFATAAALGCGAETGRAFADIGYLVPSGQQVEAGVPGSASAAGGFAVAIGAFCVGALAHAVRLIGPGDAGLVVLAALLAALVERWLTGRGTPRLAVAGLAALTAALVGGALVILLP